MNAMEKCEDQSGSKLSDIARHLCIPAGIATTDWYEVEERCAEFGISFDRWQQGIGILTLAHNEAGEYVCGVGGAWLSIPRQTGKTYLYGWMVFALASLRPNLTIIWTTHHLATTDQTFNKMASMSEKPALRKYIAGIRRANGQQHIKFVNGSIIRFGARAYGFGRGFDKVDIMVFDECQILTEAALSDMVPATNAARNGLPIFMGTPPRPKDPGEAFTARRAEAIEGKEKETLYVEFSADEKAKVIDWKQVAKANPSYPHRTSKTAIKRMQKIIGSDENFRREAYGIWDKTLVGQTAFTEHAWKVLKNEPPQSGVACFAVRFTPDGSTVALAAALRPQEGAVFVEGIKQAPVSDGLQWLVDFLVERKSTAAQFVIDGRAGAAYLIDALRAAGVRNKKLIIAANAQDAVNAHSLFHNAVLSGELSHSGQEELTQQVSIAKIRKIGTNGGFGFAPIVEGEQIALLEAATYAYWAAKTTKRNPDRKQVISV